MRKVIDFILTLNLLVITCFAAYLWWSGSLVVEFRSASNELDKSTLEPLALAFDITLKDEVDRTAGKPERGYEPKHLITAFAGLAQTDFEGVEASVGKYVVVDGQLVHVTPPDALLHDADGAIARDGFETLLVNISKRTHIDLAGNGTITQIMDAISTN